MACQIIYLYVEKLFFFLMNRIYPVFSSLEIPGKLIETEVYSICFTWSLQKKRDSQTFKSIAAAENLSSSGYVIGTTCFGE